MLDNLLQNCRETVVSVCMYNRSRCEVFYESFCTVAISDRDFCMAARLISSKVISNTNNDNNNTSS